MPLPLLLLAVTAPACAPPRKPPDVLLVTVDTLRADRLGVYGYPLDTSPRIDALAKQGVLFERAIAAAGRTAPAHASIFTSRYVRGHSMGARNGDSELVGHVTLAEAFAAGGYRTGAFVGNLLLAGRLGFARGFDVYDDELTVPESNRPHVLERRADDTTERALHWLAAGDEPAFLWVHYQDPHGPYTPPPPFDAAFEVPAPPDEPVLEVAAFGATAGRIPRYQAIEGLRRASQYEARYVGEIAYADRAIGRLVAALDARRRPNVVLFTADHGESLGEGGHYFKHVHSTGPDVAHVPLLLRAPGLAPERRREWVSHVDVAPTLLDLAGLPLPPDAQGVSLVRRLRGGEAWPERFVYCDHGTQLSAYAGDGFLRARGPAGAWRGGDAPQRGVAFRWSEGGVERGAERALPRAVRDYAARVEPVRALPPPDEEQLERLRALGYAD
ncbi:MAG: sulfatase [Myxococcota bacterium]